MNNIDRAIDELKKGNMIIMYDGDEREGEADMLFHAKFVTHDKIEKLRKEAGGLICLAVDERFAKRTGLPFYADVLAKSEFPVSSISCIKTAYGDKPAFSIAVNHKEVYTGITDDDRTLTIKKVAELVEKNEDTHAEFVKNFYSPGHVFLLIGSGIERRKGHTELTLELARKAGMKGAIVLCEMLGKKKAVKREHAKEYAKKNNIVFVEGKEIWSK